LRRAVRQAQLTASAGEAVTAREYPDLPGPLPADFNPQLARRVLDSAIEETAGATPPVEVRRVVIERHPAPASSTLRRAPRFSSSETGGTVSSWAC